MWDDIPTDTSLCVVAFAYTPANVPRKMYEICLCVYNSVVIVIIFCCDYFILSDRFRVRPFPSLPPLKMTVVAHTIRPAIKPYTNRNTLILYSINILLYE